MTFRATTSPARSSNSLVCKFSYIPPDAVSPASPGWNPDFLKKVGLGELVDRGLGALGGVTGKTVEGGDANYLGAGEEALVMTAGLPVGKGLSARAAKELGLVEGTAVGSGVIDACESGLYHSLSRFVPSVAVADHLPVCLYCTDAGWIGTAAALSTDANDPNPAETLKTQKHPTLADSGKRLAAVAGTSTCHIVQVRPSAPSKPYVAASEADATHSSFSPSRPRVFLLMESGVPTRTPCTFASPHRSIFFSQGCTDLGPALC